MEGDPSKQQVPMKPKPREPLPWEGEDEEEVARGEAYVAANGGVGKGMDEAEAYKAWMANAPGAAKNGGSVGSGGGGGGIGGGGGMGMSGIGLGSGWWSLLTSTDDNKHVLAENDANGLRGLKYAPLVAHEHRASVLRWFAEVSAEAEGEDGGANGRAEGAEEAAEAMATAQAVMELLVGVERAAAPPRPIERKPKVPRAPKPSKPPKPPKAAAKAKRYGRGKSSFDDDEDDEEEEEEGEEGGADDGAAAAAEWAGMVSPSREAKLGAATSDEEEETGGGGRRSVAEEVVAPSKSRPGRTRVMPTAHAPSKEV